MRYKLRFSLFFFAMFLYMLSSNFIHPVTPTLIQNLNLPDYMFGLMLATNLLFLFLFSPFWGKINTFVSSRTSLLIGCVGYSVAQLGFAHAKLQAVILLFRAMAGFFASAAFVSFLTYVINAAKPEDQAKFLTYSATIQAVATAFGYLVGGLLGEFSILGTFYIHVTLVTTCGILFRFCCEADHAIPEKLPMKEILKDANPIQAFLDGKRFMNKAFALLFAVNILMNFGNTGFDQAFNYYLKDQLGLTSSYNGIIKAAVGFITFVANMTLCMWIIHKTNVKKSTAVVALFCTAASVGALLIPELRSLIAFSIMVYVGYSVSLPLVQHMAAEQANPAQKNLVMGFYNATKYLGSVIGSLTAGFLYSVHSKLPFAVVAVAYGVSFLTALAYLLYHSKAVKVSTGSAH